MKLKLEDLDNKDLLEKILSIKQFDLKSKINFLRPVPFKELYYSWLTRTRTDSSLLMSDTLHESFKNYSDEKIVLLYIESHDFFLALFLDETKTKLFGHVQKQSL